VSSAPGTSPYVLARSGSGDELHVVVIDRDGEVTGTPGEILETYDSMSKASDAKKSTRRHKLLSNSNIKQIKFHILDGP